MIHRVVGIWFTWGNRRITSQIIWISTKGVNSCRRSNVSSDVRLGRLREWGLSLRFWLRCCEKWRLAASLHHGRHSAAQQESSLWHSPPAAFHLPWLWMLGAENKHNHFSITTSWPPPSWAHKCVLVNSHIWLVSSFWWSVCFCVFALYLCVNERSHGLCELFRGIISSSVSRARGTAFGGVSMFYDTLWIILLI